MGVIEVNRPWIPPKDELYQMYDEILESRKLTNNSKYVKLLESELAAKTQMPHVYSTSNGTLALHLAIRALDIQPGEIITTPFSFIATSSSIIWEGHKPVFADVDPKTLCLDADLIEERITERTRAIIAVHVFGNACEIDRIETLSVKYGLPVIYDAAHAFGVQYKGRSILSYGDISTLSMHATKIVSTVEGGAIFCRDEELADRVFKLRYFGKDSNNREEIIGTNAKMNEFNAAFGLLSLAHFDREVTLRRKIAAQYETVFNSLDHMELLKPLYNDNRCYSYFPVLLSSENEVIRLIDAAKKRDIIIRRYWHPSLNTIDYIGADPGETPVSVDAANRIVCLPIYGEMNEDDVSRVISVFID